MTENASNQGKVGYGSPPVEHQFKPGEVANPAGPPKARTQLWRYFCTYMDMTDAKLKSTKAKLLTQSQQAAMKLVEDMKAGKLSRSSKFMQYCVDRELGKPKEHVQIDSAPTLSADDCESIRDILRQNANSDR